MIYLAGNHLLNVNNGITRKICEIYSKLTVKMPERPQSFRIGVFMVNSEPISRIVLVLSLLADIEQINIDWVKPLF